MAERKKPERRDLAKRAAVEKLLLDPKWFGRNNGHVAGEAGVSRALVIRVRKEMEDRGEIAVKDPGSRNRDASNPARATRPATAMKSGSDDGSAELLNDCRELARTLTAKLAQLATRLDQGGAA